MKIITNSEQETFSFGQELGRACRGGEVFLLVGELGAGKTKLLQGLASGLGVKDTVNSPTFNILKIYPATRVQDFCHIDAYRLHSDKDLTALGVQEFFASPVTVTAVEWAEKIKPIWPRGARLIKITSLSENSREIIVA